MRMYPQIKVEWLKEKRAANRKLLWIAPVIFVLLSFLLVLLMGPSPDGEHNYIIAATFNWYSLIILPIIISFLVTNNLKKEKTVHQVFYQTTGASLKDQLLGKNIVVITEMTIILVVSVILVFLLGNSVLNETIIITDLLKATFYLIIGSLPIVGLSFVMYYFLNQTVVILINFVLGNVAAIVAVESWWWLFPWSYNLRMMAPALRVHPNGTFLTSGDPLLSKNALLIGVIMATVSYFLLLIIQFLLTRRVKRNV